MDLVLKDVLVDFDDADVAAVDDRDMCDVLVDAVFNVPVALEVVNVEVVDVDVVVVVVSHPLHVLSHWPRACPHKPCAKTV